MLYVLLLLVPAPLYGANLGNEVKDRAKLDTKSPVTVALSYGLGSPGIYQSAEFYARSAGELVISVLGGVTKKAGKISTTISELKSIQAKPGVNKVDLNWSVGPDDLIAFSWTGEGIIPYDKDSSRNYFIKGAMAKENSNLKLSKSNEAAKRKYSFRVTYKGDGIEAQNIGFPPTSRNEFVNAGAVTYIVDQEITVKGSLSSIKYFGKKKRLTHFWLFRSKGGNTYTAVKTIKSRAKTTGLNEVSVDWGILPGDKMGFSSENLGIAYSIEDDLKESYNYLKFTGSPDLKNDINFDEKCEKNQIFSLEATILPDPTDAPSVEPTQAPTPAPTGVFYGNDPVDAENKDVMPMTTLDLANQIKYPGTVTSVSFFSRDTSPIKILLYRPAIMLRYPMQAGIYRSGIKRVALTEVTPIMGVNKVELSGFVAEKGDLMGFASPIEQSFGSLPYNSTNVINYLMYPGAPIPDLPFFSATGFGARIYPFGYTLDNQ